MIHMIHGDCMIEMAKMPDKEFSLALVDPPYGIGECQDRVNNRVTKKINLKWRNRKAPKYSNAKWDTEKPSQEYFDEVRRVSSNQIIWGANHFGNMPPSSGWVVWFKKRFDEKNDFSDAELAYTSFNKGCRLFHLPWIGFGAVNANEKRIHNTQKPVALYKWLLQNYAKKGDKILDTHGGSFSSAIAAYDLGFDYTGIELDEDYFTAAKARFDKHVSQGTLFNPDLTPAETLTQGDLI